MLPNREGHVKIAANMDGEVEIRARVGQVVAPGQILAVVEGDVQIESLSVRNTSEVVEILVASGSDVPKGTNLMIVREIQE